MTELFRTIHGSRLYGLDHAGSDDDIFIVTDSVTPRARQHVGASVDVLTIGFNAFMTRCWEGSHQSLEALFSPFKEWNVDHEQYALAVATVTNLRVPGAFVAEKYERTIKRFCYGDFKRRRHAVRLAMNLDALRVWGGFNPRMTPIEIETANKLAEHQEGEELWNKLMT